MKINKEWIFLGLILVLAGLLRFWKLSVVPPGLFGDEIDVGYQAYSILKTGGDYYGNFLPTYIHSLAEWRAPLFIYSTIPSIILFGLDEIGVRFSSAFFGLLGILFLFFLIKGVAKNSKLALITAFLLAVSPWHIQYSRAAFEVTLLLALFLGGVLFFFKGFSRPSLLVLSAILLALTPYTYSTGSLFLPLILSSLFIIYRKEILQINKKWLLLSSVLSLVVLSPFITSLVSGSAAHRFSQISIFSDDQTVDRLNIARTQGTSFENLFHNRPIAWGQVFTDNYLTAFSPQFLFLRGDPNSRHSSGTGELYLVLLPLILLGMLAGKKIAGSQFYHFMIAWLVVSPVPSALTQDGGIHATRLFLMLPPFIFFGALGLIILWQSRGSPLKTVFMITIIGLLLVESSFYLHQYYIHYPKDSWRFWQYGYKEPMTFIAQHQKEYDRILINNSYNPSLIRFLFWAKYDPEKFRGEFKGDKVEKNILPGFDGFVVGKFYFGNLNKDGNIDSLLSPKTLYLVSQKDEVPGNWDWRQKPPEGVNVLMSSVNPFGDPLFYVVKGSK